MKDWGVSKDCLQKISSLSVLSCYFRRELPKNAFVVEKKLGSVDGCVPRAGTGTVHLSLASSLVLWKACTPCFLRLRLSL